MRTMFQFYNGLAPYYTIVVRNGTGVLNTFSIKSIVVPALTSFGDCNQYNLLLPFAHLLQYTLFCITFVFNFSWVLQSSQEKVKTICLCKIGGGGGGGGGDK